MSAEPDITYAVHTAACTFLLDREGICQRVIMAAQTRSLPKNAQNASRCVGAQYVASLDPSVPGCMVERPAVGLPMLFARVDAQGHVSLVRTDNVTRFEETRAFDPFAATSGVRTSAPELPRDLSPARPRPAPPRPPSAPPRAESPAPARRSAMRLREESPRRQLPDYDDPDARTQPVARLSPQQMAAAMAPRREIGPPDRDDLRTTAKLAGGRKRER